MDTVKWAGPCSLSWHLNPGRKVPQYIPSNSLTPWTRPEHCPPSSPGPLHLPCAPNRGLIAHHCTYLTPPLNQGTSLIPLSSFAQPLHETAIFLLPLLNSHEMTQPQRQLSVLLLPGHTLRPHAIRQAGAICKSWLPGMSTSTSKKHREASGRDGELAYPDLESRLI